jgi:hypothetical protein
MNGRAIADDVENNRHNINKNPKVGTNNSQLSKEEDELQNRINQTATIESAPRETKFEARPSEER